jgi:hypothetical protein
MDAAEIAMETIDKVTNDFAEARDNLLLTKITQTHHSDTSRGPEPNYKFGDLVMLSTKHQCHEYKKKGKKQTAKFFPRWDGPFRVTHSHPEASTYTLNIHSNAYPIYHASKLKAHLANNPVLFPGHEFTQLGPVLTADGLEEHMIDEIIDSRQRGHGWQFFVCWVGYPPHHNKWLPTVDLKDCEALDLWYQIGGDGLDTQ